MQNVPIVSIARQEYGCLVYDVPIDNKKAYHQIRHVLRKMALPINLSVYLIPWGLQGQVAKLLQDKVTYSCDIRFIKFDSSSIELLTSQVEASMQKLIGGIIKRINERVDVVKALDSTKKYAFKYDIEQKISAVEALTVIFGITQDIQNALLAVKALYKLEVEVLA